MGPMPDLASWTFKYKIGSGPKYLDLPTGIDHGNGNITTINSWIVDYYGDYCDVSGWLAPVDVSGWCSNNS
jgi:hypothetical protein